MQEPCCWQHSGKGSARCCSCSLSAADQQETPAETPTESPGQKQRVVIEQSDQVAAEQTKQPVDNSEADSSHKESEKKVPLKSALRSTRHQKVAKPKGTPFNTDSAMLTISAIRIFGAADRNGDGSLSLRELSSYIRTNPQQLAAVTEPGAPQWGDLQRLFVFDSNGDGQIQRDEWVQYYVARANELRCRAAADQVQLTILNDHHKTPKPPRKRVVWPDELLGDRDSLETVRVIENCRNDKPQYQTAGVIFDAADVNGDGELTLLELNAYILAHPKALSDVTEPGGSQWGIMMQLFGNHDAIVKDCVVGRGVWNSVVAESNGDGASVIRKADWVHYYVARSNEIKLKQEADDVQDFFSGNH